MSLSKKEKALEIGRILDSLYPDAACTLNHSNPYELLVATILSAQCTDARVNQVTPLFFARFPSPRAVAEASLESIEATIRSTGLYRNKARHIQAACRRIVETHGGEVPRTMDALLSLPGIGRKTANVILGNAFQVPGFPVDTHVARISRRLGWTSHKDPLRIEKEVTALFPPDRWTRLSHQLIRHGREVCRARSPRCNQCALAQLCDTFCCRNVTSGIR